MEAPVELLPTRTAVHDRTPSLSRLGRVHIKVISGPEEGQVFQVAVRRERLGQHGPTGLAIRVGRHPTNDLVLRDELVSGFHFSIEFVDPGIVLRDPGSTNGVFVHGIRVREALIGLDTVFSAGNTSLQITSTDKVEVPLSGSDHFDELYGWSPVMRELFAELERLAALPTSTLPILITGETGTGKELVARGLHARSARAHGPFIVLDCTALPRDLADAIVFGYNRGAFSGAHADHAGVFEQAHGGTLLIDELGELPLELQAKLLRALDRGEVCRFNDQSRVRKVDVRVLSATNRDLRRMIGEGRFREDLYFRILGKHVELPGLRERGDDVVRLAERFLAAICTQLRVPPRTLSAAAAAALRAAPWRGNVRQLKKVVECAAQLSAGPIIDVKDLSLEPPGGDLQPDSDPFLHLPWEEAQVEFQRHYIKALMQRVGTRRGWINRAAELSGMDRSGFVKALKRLGLYRPAMEES